MCQEAGEKGCGIGSSPGRVNRDGAGPPFPFTSLLGAGSQQVDDIQVVADVGQDLELGHQSLVLTGRGPLCVRIKGRIKATGQWGSFLWGGPPALCVWQRSALTALASPQSAEGPASSLYSFLPPS